MLIRRDLEPSNISAFMTCWSRYR